MTLASPGILGALKQDLNATTSTTYDEYPARIALSGFTAYGWRYAVSPSNIDYRLSQVTGHSRTMYWYILLGVNDTNDAVYGQPEYAFIDGTGDLWVANMLYHIDAITTKFSGSLIYIMRPDRLTPTTQERTDLDNLDNTQIPRLIAARANVFLGADQRTAVSAGDYLSDGIHLNGNGQTKMAAAERVKMGL